MSTHYSQVWWVLDSLLPSMSTHCSQVCSTISVTLCKAGKHPEFEEDLPSPTHTRLPLVTMVVVMRTHTSCHHHRCNLWTKTANINITIIDIHITASTSILSFFLATDALQLENSHHHLLRDSPQTLSSLLDCLTLHSHHLSCPPCKQHFCSILWTLCLANHHIGENHTILQKFSFYSMSFQHICKLYTC